MMEMQKQFEEWVIKEDFDTDYGSYIESEYNSIFTQIAWESWQASRAEIVVKLPNLFDGSPDNATYYDYMYRKSEMEKALDDAGVDYE